MTVADPDLASVVAHEISRAIKEYKGPSWEIVDDIVERAVRFSVLSPSLRGKSVRVLRDGVVSFDQMVKAAESYSYRGADGYDKSVPILGTYHCKLEVEGSVYTGVVTVWEKACYYDL